MKVRVMRIDGTLIIYKDVDYLVSDCENRYTFLKKDKTKLIINLNQIISIEY